MVNAWHHYNNGIIYSQMRPHYFASDITGHLKSSCQSDTLPDIFLVWMVKFATMSIDIASHRHLYYSLVIGINQLQFGKFISVRIMKWFRLFKYECNRHVSLMSRTAYDILWPWYFDEDTAIVVLPIAVISTAEAWNRLPSRFQSRVVYYIRYQITRNRVWNLSSTVVADYVRISVFTVFILASKYICRLVGFPRCSRLCPHDIFRWMNLHDIRRRRNSLPQMS